MHGTIGRVSRKCLQLRSDICREPDVVVVKERDDLELVRENLAEIRSGA